MDTLAKPSFSIENLVQIPFILNVRSPELLHASEVNRLNKGDRVNTILVLAKTVYY